MGNTRKNDDGFRGEYPGPLDWDAIERQLLDRARADEERGGGEEMSGECGSLDP